MCLATVTLAMAQQAKPKTDGPSIKFEKTTHDFGTFSETNSTQKCVFTFTNVGKSPLIINQAIGSCGCTIPTYTKAPIRPGEKGEIKVTYKVAVSILVILRRWLPFVQTVIPAWCVFILKAR